MAKNFIDLEELLKRTENDRELMRDLLTIFQEEFRQRHQALREAVESQNATQVVVEAHALKGMLSNLAAVEAATAIAELERLGRNNETSRFRSLPGSPEAQRPVLRLHDPADFQGEKGRRRRGAGIRG